MHPRESSTGDTHREAEERRAPDLDVEALLATLEAFPDPAVRETALDLLEAVMGLHRAAFSRILAVLSEHPAGHGIIRRLRADPLVAAILTSHGLREPEADLEDRVEAALEKVRPYMHGHGGEVELLEVRDGRVQLRLAGACHGCGFSENTLRLGIEQILRKEVPEVREIVVLGTAAPSALPAATAAATEAAGMGWERVASRDEMPEGALRTVPTEHGAILLCAAYGRVYAFRDACPAGGGSLSHGALVAFILKCPCHGQAFDVRSGRCLTRPDLALVPLPSAWENGQLRVAV